MSDAPRVKLAKWLLRADRRILQRTILIVYLVALVLAAVIGWREARWHGLFTGLVWVTLFSHLALFAVGFSREVRPRNTQVGKLQRIFTWPLIISALGGAYYGGWTRGWLWTPVAQLTVAFVFGLVLALRSSKEKSRDRALALEALTAAFSELQAKTIVAEIPGDAIRAFEDFLGFCESQPATASIIAKHGASRRKLLDEYTALLATGGNQRVGKYQLAGLALLSPTVLDYLLCSAHLSPEHKLEDVKRFLWGGPLVYVSGPVEVYEKGQSSEEPEPGKGPNTGEHATAFVARDEATTRRCGVLRRIIGGLRWAYNYRILPGLAGDGRYADLFEVAAHAVRLRRESFGEDDAGTLQFLALAQKEHGRYAEALSTLQRSQEVTTKKWNLLGNLRVTSLEHGQMLVEQAEGLRQMSEVNLLMGDLVGAQQSAEKALSLSDLARGRVMMDSDQYAARERCAIQCLELLGDIHRARGDFLKAEPVCRAALQARRDFFGRGHGETALGYFRLASLLDQAGNYQSAENLHDAAVLILEAIPTFGEVQLPRVLLARAIHRHDIGNLVGAEEDLARALALLGQMQREPSHDTILALMRLGMVLAAAARIDKALQSFTRALNLLDGFTEQVFSVSSERQRQAYLAEMVSYVETFVSFVAQNLSRDTMAVAAVFDLILKYKAIGPELLAAQRETILAHERPELATKLTELVRVRVRIAEVELSPRGGQKVSDTILKRWKRRREQIESELAATLPEIEVSRIWRNCSAQSVMTALPADSSLIEVFRGHGYNFAAVPARGEPRVIGRRYYACVLSKGEARNVSFVDLGEAEPTDALIASYRASITGKVERRGEERSDKMTLVPTDVSVRSDRSALRNVIQASVRDLGIKPDEVTRPSDTSDGEMLRQAILVPLLAAIRDHRRLFVAPDGDLLRLPLEVLPIGSDRHVIDEYDISYLTVGRDALRLSTKSRLPSAPPIVIAAPDFDLGSSTASPGQGPFAPLHGARVEGEQIAALLGVSPLIGAQALEQRIKKCQSPHILHIATHGFFLQDSRANLHQPVDQLATPGPEGDFLGRMGQIANPLLRSGLALAGANTWINGTKLPEEAEDGLFTAEDVTGIDLRHTELTVLSACETGLGEAQFGEGVLGLRRAFVLAGTKTLVMSLWKVPDEQTSDLMTDFYRLLLRGVPRAEALRESQRALRRRYPSPFYWGAFICQGEPSELVPLNSAMAQRGAGSS